MLPARVQGLELSKMTIDIMYSKLYSVKINGEEILWLIISCDRKIPEPVTFRHRQLLFYHA